MFFNIETVANNIYNACTDFDALDYIETKETEIKNLKSALEKVHDYSYYNDDFKVLAESLRVLFDQD